MARRRRRVRNSRRLAARLGPAALPVLAVTVVFASVIGALTTSDARADVTALATSGSVLITRPGATVLCDPGTPRRISVHWQTDAPGTHQPIFIFLRGGGGSFPDPYLPMFGNETLPGAFNLTVTFACMNRPGFDVNDPADQQDMLSNPEDLDLVYRRLCSGSPPEGIPGIDPSDFDCTRIGLSGGSGGGLTSLLLFNSCFSSLPVAAALDAVATRYAGFTPPFAGNSSVCPGGAPYSTTRSTPLFMKVGCADDLFPFAQVVAPVWQQMRRPKFLFEVAGGHSEQAIPGEQQIQDFFRYYLLGQASAATTLRSAIADPSLASSFLSESELGVRLDGGQCGGTFAPVVGPIAVPVQRIYGQDAIGTSISVSRNLFREEGSASAVVLARSDHFADALAGGPLAAANGGPLLITPGAAVAPALDSLVLAEIRRVLPKGGTVFVLGGPLALAPDIDVTLQGYGYHVVRLAGANQFATATAIAQRLGDPDVVLEATGVSFADALSAVPAAIALHGAILLTNGSTQAPETAAYLAAHPPRTRYAIGGPLAAGGADPLATAVFGQDLFATSAAVAGLFFPDTVTFGAATGLDFPDALSGSVFMGASSHRGPVLLVNPDLPLPPSIAGYLAGHPKIAEGYVFGGPLAVSNAVLAAL